jgi:hypothetical protein
MDRDGPGRLPMRNHLFQLFGPKSAVHEGHKALLAYLSHISTIPNRNLKLLQEGGWI